MRHEPALCTDGLFVVTQERTGRRLGVALSGRLDLDSVEDLAACTDEICRSAVRYAVFDVAALTGVDEAGARTLAAAFGCLAAHSVTAWVRGVGGELQAMLDRLGLTLPVLPARSIDATAAAATGAALVPASADLVGLGVAREGAAGGLTIGHPGRGDGGHDGAELAGLVRGDAVKQRPPDLLDV
jgi:anti-anti-sigma regulatory factor